jgi:hypothetical protein
MTHLGWSDVSPSPPSEDEWVPSVNPSELKNPWEIGRNALANASGERINITRGDYPGVSSATWFRAAILHVMSQHFGLLRSALPVAVKDVVSRIVSEMPMKSVVAEWKADCEWVVAW